MNILNIELTLKGVRNIKFYTFSNDARKLGFIAFLAIQKDLEKIDHKIKLFFKTTKFEDKKDE